MTTVCSKCGVSLAEYDWSGRLDSNFEPTTKIDGGNYCASCASPAKIASEQRKLAMNSGDDAIWKIPVTTTPSIDGYKVANVVDVISAECVFGMNIFKDFFASLTDIFGGRSGTSQSALREARQLCVYELRAEAHRLGANAVIGVNLDYSEFSGQGKSMLFLVASGTAVVLEKVGEAHAATHS